MALRFRKKNLKKTIKININNHPQLLELNKEINTQKDIILKTNKLLLDAKNAKKRENNIRKEIYKKNIQNLNIYLKEMKNRLKENKAKFKEIKEKLKK